ncbi:MAG: tetratricopeptide repeat protein [Clostridium sp.]|uniref:tetratricopeptide repeat protein n=1 Tax=Clostridium sp. TaxID=1506 RepID=UPI002A84516D|nr:tetratricopeptide repeat protein [Clostridium sp.]MDY5097576.1 tetratricopeptide repeat protein [Clostridium sp.]
MENWLGMNDSYEEAAKLYNNMKVRDALIMLLYECEEGFKEEIQVKLLIGKCYFALGKYDLARKYYKEALDIDKKNKEAKLLMKELGKISKKYTKEGKSIPIFIIGRCYI